MERQWSVSHLVPEVLISTCEPTLSMQSILCTYLFQLSILREEKLSKLTFFRWGQHAYAVTISLLTSWRVKSFFTSNFRRNEKEGRRAVSFEASRGERIKGSPACASQKQCRQGSKCIYRECPECAVQGEKTRRSRQTNGRREDSTPWASAYRGYRLGLACACAVVGHFKAGHRVNIHYALHQPLDVLAEFFNYEVWSLFIYVVVSVHTTVVL